MSQDNRPRNVGCSRFAVFFVMAATQAGCGPAGAALAAHVETDGTLIGWLRAQHDR